MIVSIQQIAPGSLMTVPGTSQMGFLADFESSVMSGQAVFVPRGGVSASLRRDQKIKVDPRPDYITDFQILEKPAVARVRSLSEPGSYWVEGPIVFSHENGEFGVQVGDCLLTLTEDDSRGLEPAKGNWVSFHLHGLSLWGT